MLDGNITERMYIFFSSHQLCVVERRISYCVSKIVVFLSSFKLFQVAQAVAPNMALFLPRNVDLDQLAELSWLASPPLPCEVICSLE